MKKTKRQQNSMIINLVFNTILLCIFLLVTWVYIYPNINDISDKKIQASDLTQELDRVQKEGLSFSEFSIQRQDMSGIENISTQKLLEQVDIDFYKNNLQDSDSTNFLNYIAEKKKLLANDVNLLEQRDSNIDTILPPYGELGSDSKAAITDFEFTSYLERLFSTFNLKYSGKIGIGELEPVGVLDTEQSNAEKDLNTSIYSTDLKLDIVWRKRDIIHFIHYFENVWAVGIDDDSNLEVYNDNTITQLGKTVILNGDNRTNNYNLYLHQLGDIEYIRFNKYIDGDLEFRKLEQQSLADFVKQNQWSQKYEFEVGLRFYFKGLPKYKVRDFITTFLNNHKDAQKLVKKNIISLSKQSSLTSDDRQLLWQLKSIDAWLIDTTKKVKTLTKDSKHPDKIESVYRQVISLNETLEKIMQLVDTQKETNNTDI